MRSSCCHALSLDDDVFCDLRSNRDDGSGNAFLVFHLSSPFVPIKCDAKMFRACPHKQAGNGKPMSSKGAIDCEHCGKRHIPGSLNEKMCGEWHSFKRAHKETAKSMPGKRKWYLYGSSEEIFSTKCDSTVRRQLWPRIQVTILRRDNFTCQECGRDHRQLPRKRNGRAELEVHHIIPRSLGGTEHPGNLVTLCRDCHRGHTEKGTIRLRELQRNEREVGAMCMEEHLNSIDDELPDDLASLEFQ